MEKTPVVSGSPPAEADLLLTFFAFLGVAAAIGIPIYILVRISKDKGRRNYVFAAAFVLLVCIIAAALIWQISGDDREAATNLIVGALSTIGWIFTILYLRDSASSETTLQQVKNREKFYETTATSNQTLVESIQDLARAFASDADISRKITQANEAVVQRLEHLQTALIGGRDVSTSQRKRDLTVRLIELHLNDPELLRWRAIVAKRFPPSISISPEEARVLFQVYKSPPSSRETNEDAEVATAIASLLNFFETVALFDCCGLLDRQLLVPYFGGIIPNAHKKFGAFIDQATGAGVTSENNTYIYLRNLIKRWPSYDPELRPRVSEWAE